MQIIEGGYQFKNKQSEKQWKIKNRLSNNNYQKFKINIDVVLNSKYDKEFKLKHDEQYLTALFSCGKFGKYVKKLRNKRGEINCNNDLAMKNLISRDALKN